ncbi:cytochrome b6 [Uruburuella testudinis]|uniref:Cytochrome b6 n=1 Tax=Uruburuella testudinis TaxID=1282863 RepID=A0ABY4DPY5_9NEIS|nr:cytochrome b6 [Uruburuella testudinis]UOO80936.1 cytochrome b6 [Uruburuella testudinis]
MVFSDLLRVMNTNAEIRRATRLAFIFIALMMLAFVLFVLVMVLPLGLDAVQQLWAVRMILYTLLALALAGAAFSVRVARLRKRGGK